MLERDFDLVYPSERFGEGMEAIAKELGLAEWAFNASRMQAVAPKWNTVSGAPSAHRKARSIEDPRLCGNMTACVALVHHIGAWDQILYERAARRFEQQYERVRLTPFVPPSVAPPRVDGGAPGPLFVGSSGIFPRFSFCAAGCCRRPPTRRGGPPCRCSALLRPRPCCPEPRRSYPRR